MKGSAVIYLSARACVSESVCERDRQTDRQTHTHTHTHTHTQIRCKRSKMLRFENGGLVGTCILHLCYCLRLYKGNIPLRDTDGEHGAH